MKTLAASILFSILILHTYGQDEISKPKTSTAWKFSLGVRSTQSQFGALGYSGMGFGGQFRIRISNRLNTEWFADHIKTDLGGLGHRETAHIGWSVMFYPLYSEVKRGAFLPYILAGHCFDFAKVNGYQHSGISEINTEFETKRWSSAVQMGIGASYQLTERFDISFSAQYMIHLGNDLNVSEEQVNITLIGPHLRNNGTVKQLGAEGHVLLSFSLNYMLTFKNLTKS